MRFTGRLSHCMKFAIWICYWPFPSIIALPYHIGKCYNTLAWNVNRECYWINKTNSYTLGRTFNVFERLAMFFATRLTPLVEWFSLHTTLVLFSASLPNLRPLHSFFSRSLVPPLSLSWQYLYIFKLLWKLPWTNVTRSYSFYRKICFLLFMLLASTVTMKWQNFCSQTEHALMLKMQMEWRRS